MQTSCVLWLTLYSEQLGTPDSILLSLQCSLSSTVCIECLETRESWY